jgi:hypothetical protein
MQQKETTFEKGNNCWKKFKNKSKIELKPKSEKLRNKQKGCKENNKK